MTQEYLLSAILIIPTVVILALLLVLLRLSGRRGFNFRARGFGVSVNLVTEEEAADNLAHQQGQQIVLQTTTTADR